MRNVKPGPQTAATFTTMQLASVIALGIGGTIITALQPVLLGAMVHSDKLTAAQLGYAATAELTGMGILATIGGARFKPQKLRLIALAAVLVAMAANLTTVFGSGYVIVTARFVAGCSSGVLLWLMAGLLVRVTSPERLVGIYTAVQSILALALAALCGEILVPRLGGSGAFGCLLAINVLMVGLTFLAPPAYAPLPAGPRVSALPQPRAWAALAAVSAFMAALLSLYVYVPTLLSGEGAGVAAGNYTIDASLACQILGGVVAATVGRRIGYITALSVTTLGGFATAAAFGMPAPVLVNVAAGGVFGLVWMVAVAYQIPFLIAADPTRRAAMFSSPAQLLGCALGPLITSLTIVGKDAHGAVVVSMACFALSFLLLWGVHLRIIRQRRTVVAVAE